MLSVPGYLKISANKFIRSWLTTIIINDPKVAEIIINVKVRILYRIHIFDRNTFLVNGQEVNALQKLA